MSRNTRPPTFARAFGRPGSSPPSLVPNPPQRISASTFVSNGLKATLYCYRLEEIFLREIDDLTTKKIKPAGNIEEMWEGLPNPLLGFRLRKKQHESPVPGSQKFATQGSSPDADLVNGVDLRIRYARSESTLELPLLVEQPTEIPKTIPGQWQLKRRLASRVSNPEIDAINE